MAASAGKRYTSNLTEDVVIEDKVMEVQQTQQTQQTEMESATKNDDNDGENDAFHDSKQEIDSETDSNISTLLMKMHDDLRGMRTDIRELTSKVDYTLQEIVTCKSDIKELQNTTSTLSTELQTSKNEIVALKSQNADLQNRMVQLDSYIRRDNLIFYGVRQIPDEDCFHVFKSVLSTKLGITNTNDIKLERCHRLRSKANPKPLIVRFNCYQDRVRVWKCRKMLQGSDISMGEDFPPEIIESRKTLYPILKKAKELKKEAFLVADKLTIEGTVYTVSNLHCLPPDLDPAGLATKKLGNVTAFYSKSSPLSNFYETNIKIDNDVFATVEQYLQYQKAVFANKPDVARRIKNTKSPGLCKKFGDELPTEDSSWLPLAKKTLEKACIAKFQQNAYAKMFLLNTGETVLAEATRDKHWGIGLSLNSPLINNQANWTGSNTFGNILMTVREHLK